MFVNYGRPVDYLQLQELFNTTGNIFEGKILLVKQYHLSASEQVCRKFFFEKMTKFLPGGKEKLLLKYSTNSDNRFQSIETNNYAHLLVYVYAH